MKKRLRLDSVLVEIKEYRSRKVFADEEAIETLPGYRTGRSGCCAGKYSLMKKRLRPYHARCCCHRLLGRKVFADEEAIETRTGCLRGGRLRGRKVFADEEAIETSPRDSGEWRSKAGKYSLMKKRLRLH